MSHDRGAEHPAGWLISHTFPGRRSCLDEMRQSLLRDVKNEKDRELRVGQLAPELQAQFVEVREELARPWRGGVFDKGTTRNSSTRPSAYPVHNGGGQERGNPWRTVL